MKNNLRSNNAKLQCKLKIYSEQLVLTHLVNQIYLINNSVFIRKKVLFICYSADIKYGQGHKSHKIINLEK